MDFFVAFAAVAATAAVIWLACVKARETVVASEDLDAIAAKAFAAGKKQGIEESALQGKHLGETCAARERERDDYFRAGEKLARERDELRRQLDNADRLIPELRARVADLEAAERNREMLVAERRSGRAVCAMCNRRIKA